MNLAVGPSTSIANSILETPPAASENKVVVVPMPMNKPRSIRVGSRPTPIGMMSKSQSHPANGGLKTKDAFLAGTLLQQS